MSDIDPDIERFCRMMDRGIAREAKISQICSAPHQATEQVFGVGEVQFIDPEKEHRQRIKDNMSGGWNER